MNAAANDGGAAAAAAQVQNIKRMIGPVAYVDRKELEAVLDYSENTILVESYQGVFGKSYHYLLHAFGITWYCKSKHRMRVPEGIPIVQAKNISVPT